MPELSRNIPRSTSSIDLYRRPLRLGPLSARRDGGDADPTQIEFPDMVRGTFDKDRVAGQRELSDGTTYRLWRLTGDFKNDFDLRRYPADRQRLQVPVLEPFVQALIAERRVAPGEDVLSRSSLRRAATTPRSTSSGRETRRSRSWSSGTSRPRWQRRWPVTCWLGIRASRARFAPSSSRPSSAGYPKPISPMRSSCAERRRGEPAAVPTGVRAPPNRQQRDRARRVSSRRGRRHRPERVGHTP